MSDPILSKLTLTQEGNLACLQLLDAPNPAYGCPRQEKLERKEGNWVPELLAPSSFLQDASGAFKLKVLKMNLCLMGMKVHQPN